MIRLICILSFLFFIEELRCQEIPANIRQQIESFLEDQEIDDLDVFELYENLVNYIESPIDINNSDLEIFKELRLLSAFQINELKDHIDRNGQLLALEELQSIPSFDKESINRILPFISLQNAEKYQVPLGRLITEGTSELYLKWRRVMEDQIGYIPNENGETPYAGDPNRLFVKYKYNYESRFRYGFTMEKDSGEDFFRGSNPQGFDFMSAYIYSKDISKFIKDLIIGDYTVSLGQGLIAHNAFGAGKSAWTTDIKRGGRVFRPYNSVGENFFFRGVATTLKPMKNIELSMMLSAAPKDGNIDTTEIENNEELIISFTENGSHRTASEIAREKTLRELSFGGSLKYRNNKGYIALNYLHQSFGKTYQFNLNKFQNTSLDYSLRHRNFHFFGESAYSLQSNNISHLHGILIGLTQKANLALSYRNYPQDYSVFRPNSFGESTTGRNEEGLYLGIEVVPHRDWKIRAYADVWKNPFLRFRINKPSTGKEYLLRIDYLKKRTFNLYIQLLYEQKERNLNAEEQSIFDPDNRFRSIEFTNRYRFRCHFNYKVSKAVELRSRIEYSRFEHVETHNGILMYQDIIYKPIAFPLSITARYAIFDIEDSDARIYTYENDILYEFFIPSFGQGNGTRYYINFRYDLSRFLTAEFRIARTYFQDAFAISSGNELSIGNSRTELKAQLRFKF